MAQPLHVGSCNVQRKPRLTVKCRVLAGIYVLDPSHVRRPVELWVACAADHEVLVWERPRRSKQQRIERRLAIVAVRAEIAECLRWGRKHRSIQRGVDGATKGQCELCATLALDQVQDRAS